ncbi:MAG: hypothetical protein HYY37_00565 [Candidatus Aenigmarchaeota archaeon]|nr:hypothetical protein [Candidatus Aenigmarchaeota archaeon]
MATSGIREYIFLRGRVPTLHEMLDGERRIVEANKFYWLRRYLAPESLPHYAHAVGTRYNTMLEQGLLKQGRLRKNDMERIVASAQKRTEAYWNVPLRVSVQILPEGAMLEAEHEYVEKRMRELAQEGERTTIEKPVLPSPYFTDDIERRLVLSDRYIALIGQEKRPYGSVYYTGGARAQAYPWNEKLLLAEAVSVLNVFAMKQLRGETGEHALKLFELPPESFHMLHGVLTAGSAHSLPAEVPDGGIPALMRRIRDIYTNPETQMNCVAFKALADDMGTPTACLFDGFLIGRSPQGPSVHGYLWGRHPSYKEKDAAVNAAAQMIAYPFERTVLPEDFFG